MRPRSLRWHAAIAVFGAVLILLAAGILLDLLRLSGVGFGRAAGLSTALIFFTGVLLGGVFLWSRRRVLDELRSLVTFVERADPDISGSQTLAPMRVNEFERLRVAFTRFSDRFAASRVRQEEAEGTLGHILGHAADAIVVLDGRHRIVSWNRGAEETFGFCGEEVLLQPYTLLVPGREEEPELRTPLKPGLTVKDFRTRRVRRDGQVLDVSLTRSRIPARGGGEERSVEILRDISEKRRLEEDLLRTEKMAAVGKISSKVVHEIRNPLASINLNVDLLRDSLNSASGMADPEAREILSIIKNEVRRLSQITEEYLQFSRLPRVAFRQERVNDIMIELADFVRPSLHRKGIRLALILDESDPEAICDATLLRQALLNLLRNAMDATKEGEGQVQMRTRVILPAFAGVPGDRPEGRSDAVEISVEDNGSGIPPEQQAMIFEPFYTTKRDGTGLGLALVKRAVEEHGGTIRCISDPGRGTAFRVLLPSCPAPGLASSPQSGL